MASKVNHALDLELYGIGTLLALSVLGFIWVSFYYR